MGTQHWRQNSVVECPAPAGTWGFATLAFQDEFTSLSTIDTTNSKTAGYKWYIDGKWPQLPTQLNHNAWNSGPTKVADLSITSSILTVTNTQGASFFSENSLNTAYATGVGSTYGGTAFSGGWYFEGRMQYNPSLASQSTYNTDPIFWFIALEGLCQTSNEFMECDVMEAFPTGSGTVQPLFGMEDWNSSAGTANQNTNVNWSYGGADLSQAHTYGMLWVPMAKNGGTGLIQFYVDNAHIAAQDISYTASGAASPGASPSNPNGTFSIMDSQHFCLMIGCGPSWPNNVDFVRVWQ